MWHVDHQSDQKQQGNKQLRTQKYKKDLDTVCCSYSETFFLLKPIKQARLHGGRGGKGKTKLRLSLTRWESPLPKM